MQEDSIDVREEVANTVDELRVLRKDAKMSKIVKGDQC
jgi:hypothetical protein